MMERLNCQQCDIGIRLNQEQDIPLHGPQPDARFLEDVLNTPYSLQACILAGIGYCQKAIENQRRRLHEKNT